jgi:hypothetical protein
MCSVEQLLQLYSPVRPHIKGNKSGAKVAHPATLGANIPADVTFFVLFAAPQLI